VNRRPDDARFLGPAELADVGASREDPLAAGHHDGTGQIGGEGVGDLVQPPQQRARQGVHLGIVERDHGDAVVAPVEVDELLHALQHFTLV